LGTHFLSFSPLPVVAVVVDLLDRDCRFGRDIVWEFLNLVFDFFLICRLLETGLTFLVLG